MIASLWRPLVRIPLTRGLFSAFNHRTMAKEAESQAKRQKSDVTIGTHDGVFHCDESLACFLVKQLPQYRDAIVVRSRDDKVLDTCDIVLDVGGVYDPDKNRFDHHQGSFNLTLSNIFPKKTFGNVRLSSAGLVYAHFGHDIISKMLGFAREDWQTEKVFDLVYEHFIKEIDAIDNGVSMFDGEPNYTINTHLSARVGGLKPRWNEESNADILYSRFLQAIQLTGREFTEAVDYYGKAWLPARSIVLDAFHKRHQVHPTGRIILLQTSAPWIQHLFEIEQEEQVPGQIYYVLFQDSNLTWRVRAVPQSPQSFELRHGLLVEWRGLRDQELVKLSGIEDCTFVHSTGFIGGNRTMEGALAMAKKSLL